MNWFETKATFEKDDNGRIRKVTETYLIDAETFAEAEEKLAELMQGRGAFTAEAVKKVKLYDLYLNHKSFRYYRAKVGFITLDEKAGLEKKKYVHFIIEADDIQHALDNLQNSMQDTLGEYEVASVSETPYAEVVPYKISQK